jgi:acetyltransferase-like isoleucine patch superfamily enzyme
MTNARNPMAQWRRLDRLRGVIIARYRARRFGRSAELGSRVRFGRGVRCDVAPGGRLVIGDDVEIGALTSLTVKPGGELLIGNDVFISGLCTIAAEKHVSIGSGAMIAEMVSIRDHDHDPSYPPKDGRTVQADVAIGERVWLGAKSTIVRGGSVGEDAVVGANAVVNRAVPARCLAAGVPAQIKRDNVKGGEHSG